VYSFVKISELDVYIIKKNPIYIIDTNENFDIFIFFLYICIIHIIMEYFNPKLGISLSLLIVVVLCFILMFNNIYILITYLSILSIMSIIYTRYYKNYIYTGIFIILSGGICVFQYYRNDILPSYGICT